MRMSMRYSDDIIEEVRMKNDIVDVVSQYVKLTRKGSSYFGLCPFHNEKTPSFSVTPSKQMYYCFGCGAGGNVFNFIMNMKTSPSGKPCSIWLTEPAYSSRGWNIPGKPRKKQSGKRSFWRSIKKLPSIFTISFAGRMAGRPISI